MVSYTPTTGMPSFLACLYVNVVFSLVAVTAAVRLLRNQPRDSSVRLDPPGTVLVVAGLIGVVYGLSEAETKGWGAPLTIALLVAGVVLLAAFVVVERRVAHPLLPLRIVLDRFRGGAYLAIGLSATGMFAIFLFLTYYVQLKERGFHVRLDGPPGLRAVQGAAIEGVGQEEARRHMDAADRARTAYVCRLYRADPADPRHYHLVMDSTAIPLDAVVEMILRALSSFPAAQRQSSVNVREGSTGI
jgi:Cytidylate kinase-like family